MVRKVSLDDEVPLEIDEEEEKKLEIIPATKTKKSKGGKKKEEPAFHFEFDAGDVRGVCLILFPLVLNYSLLDRSITFQKKENSRQYF